jgi:hypothetical protein
MSYTYLQEQGEESSAESFADIPQYVLSRLNLTAEKCYCSGNVTESCQCFQFGTMCEHLTENLGKGKLTSSAEDSPVRTLARQGQTVATAENKKDLLEVAADFGRKCAELLTKFNLELVLLKTPLCCGHADLALCCKTLPRWGMMQDGECLAYATLARITSEKGFLSMLPTPTCHNAKEGGYPAEHTRNTPTLAAQIGGKVNPEWNEWRMGWPIGASGLEPLEMDKFQQWLHLHGKRCHNKNETLTP